MEEMKRRGKIWTSKTFEMRETKSILYSICCTSSSHVAVTSPSDLEIWKVLREFDWRRWSPYRDLGDHGSSYRYRRKYLAHGANAYIARGWKFEGAVVCDGVYEPESTHRLLRFVLRLLRYDVCCLGRSHPHLYLGNVASTPHVRNCEPPSGISGLRGSSDNDIARCNRIV
jgi:hypothetical protein